jgi:hypothetical protein
MGFMYACLTNYLQVSFLKLLDRVPEIWSWTFILEVVMKISLWTMSVYLTS